MDITVKLLRRFDTLCKYCNTTHVVDTQSMASLIRNVTFHLGSGSGKTSDAQLAQAIESFRDEREKLTRFNREFQRYLDAMVTFDNAAFRFNDSIKALYNPTWNEVPGLEKLCLDFRTFRNDRLQTLKNQIIDDIQLTTVKFQAMKIRIDNQSQLEQNYNRTNRQYRSSMKSDNQSKIEQLKNEVHQLQSALKSANEELNNKLPQLQQELRTDYMKTIQDVFDNEGKYFKIFYKTCSRFVKNLKKKRSPDSDEASDADIVNETGSSRKKGGKNKTHVELTAQPKRHKHKILYTAQVIQDYQAGNNDELSLSKDEYISMIRFEDMNDSERDEGWEYAQNAHGAIGLVPMNFITRLYDNETEQS